MDEAVALLVLICQQLICKSIDLLSSHPRVDLFCLHTLLYFVVSSSLDPRHLVDEASEGGKGCHGIHSQGLLSPPCLKDWKR